MNKDEISRKEIKPSEEGWYWVMLCPCTDDLYKDIKEYKRDTLFFDGDNWKYGMYKERYKVISIHESIDMQALK